MTGEDETPTRKSSLKGPFRTHDDRGRQVVQVSFRASYRTYAYVAPVGTTLRVGDLVRVPPNDFKPEGSTARVQRLGSEYAGELTEIQKKIERKPDHHDRRKDLP